MAIQEWEYCALYLDFLTWVEHEKIGKKGWLCDCHISYIGNNVYRETISISEEREENKEFYFLWSINTWEQSIGILGTMGWELVSIQYGLPSPPYVENKAAVAFFKRTKVKDKPVNEPKLMLSQEPERLESSYGEV